MNAGVIRPGADGIEFDVVGPVPQGGAPVAGTFVGQGDVVVRVAVVGHQANGGAVGLDSLRKTLQLVEHIAKVEEGQRIIPGPPRWRGGRVSPPR